MDDPLQCDLFGDAEDTLKAERFNLAIDGKIYAIDDVRSIRRSSSRKVGGDGICYTIRIGERIIQLYYEDPRWFVEELLSDELVY